MHGAWRTNRVAARQPSGAPKGHDRRRTPLPRRDQGNIVAAGSAIRQLVVAIRLLALAQGSGGFP